MRSEQRSGSAWFCLVLSIGFAWLPCGSSHAYESDQAAACATIEEDLARLACYDAIFRQTTVPAVRTVAAKETPDAASESTAAVASEAADAATAFGAEDLPIETVERVQRVDTIEARVVEVERDRRGKHVVRLDNGQTWRQVESTDAVPVRVGDMVRIRRGAFDAYRLWRPSGGRTVTVRRVQ